MPPGCTFRVSSVLPQGELTVIQVEELPSNAWIMDLNTTPASGSDSGDLERMRSEVETAKRLQDEERRRADQVSARS